MQPLNDGPRDPVQPAVVKELLQSHRTIQIFYGADALDDGFNVVADIGGYMVEGSTITSSLGASIHRVCSLNIQSDVTSTGWSYLSGFVRPYMRIVDPESLDEAVFHLGVYTLPTPQRELGVTPGIQNFAGYDLIYLLKQPIGDSYEVPAGQDPASAAATAIGLAIPGVTVDVVGSGETLPGRLSWPFNPGSDTTTWYDVVQTLLAACGYMPVWVDWDGVFQVKPFADLQEEDPEWTFDLTEDDNIVSERRTQDVDLFNVPNWWRFVVADLTDSPVEGVTMFTWEDSSLYNPGSTANRGRYIRYVEAVPAASYTALKNYAQRKIAATLAPSEIFTVETQPFPLAWHLDVIEYVDPALEESLPFGQPGRRKVVATEWELPLDGMSDMKWTWRTINEQTAALDLTTTTD